MGAIGFAARQVSLQIREQVLRAGAAPFSMKLLMTRCAGTANPFSVSVNRSKSVSYVDFDIMIVMITYRLIS